MYGLESRVASVETGWTDESSHKYQTSSICHASTFMFDDPNRLEIESGDFHCSSKLHMTMIFAPENKKDQWSK